VTSPTHDATALAAAFVLFPPAGDTWRVEAIEQAVTASGVPSGLLITVLLIGVMGLAEAVASAQHRPRERAWREERRELKAQGVDADDLPYGPRWKGPPRRLTRPLRLLAVIGAAGVSLPIAVALGCARLPDQLEVGPWKVKLGRWHLFTIPGIDHRTVTHWLLTAVVIVCGARYGLAHVPPDVLSSAQAGEAWRALAVGYGTHLAMDACTRSGVPLLWPVVRRDLHLLPVQARPRTGYPVDTLVMLGALAGVAMLAQG
jgi:membrane-bound metal-dependent hydrolase YbcI (DUF457 family)